jgi:hypothetical protein
VLSVSAILNRGNDQTVPTPFPSSDGWAQLRHVETRVRNRRIATSARQHRWARTVAVPFICECSDDRCEALVRLTLNEYVAARDASDYLVAPGHQVDGATIVRVTDTAWLYRVA